MDRRSKKSEVRNSAKNRSGVDVLLHRLSSSSSRESQTYGVDVPQREKRIKDIPILILFVFALGSLFYLASFAVKHGNPFRYYEGYDSWGNICGAKNDPIPNVKFSGRDQTSRDFAFHMGLSDFNNWKNPFTYLRSKEKPAVICVSECPTNITTCRELLQKNGYNKFTDDFIDANICVAPTGVILEHKKLLNRCVPQKVIQIVSKAAKDVSNTAKTVASTNITVGSKSFSLSLLMRKVFVSFQGYWPETVGIAIGSSVVLCFLMTLVFLFCTRALLFVVVLLGISGSCLLTGYMWFQYYLAVTEENLEKNETLAMEPAHQNVLDYIKSAPKKAVMKTITFVNLSQYDVFTYDTTKDKSQFENRIGRDEEADPQSALFWAIGMSVICILVIALAIWFRKHMSVVITLFDEASNAIFHVPCIIVQPLVTFIFVILLFIYFFAISAFLFAIDMPVIDRRGFVSFELDNKTSHEGLFVAHLFGCWWFWEFMLACECIIVAGALADWFFKRPQNSCCPTMTPTLYVLCYQLGTAAFGSLIITLVNSVRVVVKYVRKKLQKKFGICKNDEDLCGTGCCLCAAKIISFVNSNAYVCAAISGTSFCDSGQRALVLLANNLSTTWILQCSQTIFLFLAKVAVAVLSGTIAFFYFRYNLGPEADKSDYLFLVFIAGVIAWMIARVFFSTYGQTLNTMFLCYAEDKFRHNGQALYVKEKKKGAFDSAHARFEREALHPSAWSIHEKIEQNNHERDCFCMPTDAGNELCFTEEEQETVLMMRKIFREISQRN